MALSIKTKQVAGVTAIVALVVLLLSGAFGASLANVLLIESRLRAELLLQTVYQRSFEVLGTAEAVADPAAALRADPGLRNALQSVAYGKGLAYATIVDLHGTIIAHPDVTLIGQSLEPATDFSTLLAASPVDKFKAIYTPGGRNYELRQPLLIGTEPFGSIRVGVSTLLIWDTLEEQLGPTMLTAVGTLVGALLVAMLLAQIILRPIHVLRSSLAKLGRGELDVSVDLPQDRELGELGDSFKQVTARLAADRTELADQRATLESVVDRLEDAVALFATDGTLLFANPAMEPTMAGEGGRLDAIWPADHPYRLAIERQLTGASQEESPVVTVPGLGERLVHTHTVEDAEGRPLGVMLVARNLAYLSQVESTLSYSRKLAALSRLTAGIAHEIKNPLNATMIHLELLKQRLASAPESLEHVSVIVAQVRRLDEVVQGFLKFTRPEELKLQPVYLLTLFEGLMPIIRAEAGKSQVDVRLDVPPDLPPVSGDPNLLEQAFLNLALNACQAMPNGGRLRISARAKPNRQMEIEVEDTGIGITPEQLTRIFDLYFTTKNQGSGIGLSLVYRTVQLHDGEIEVQSVPGRGTTFRVRLRQAAEVPTPEAAVSAS